MAIDHSFNHPSVVGFFLSLALPAKGDDGAAANRLFVAGLEAWNQAEALTSEGLATAERRVSLLEQVVTNLRRIVDDHTGADLAVRLLIGDQIGPLSLKVAEAALEEADFALRVAMCEVQPNRACIFTEALVTARGIEDPKSRATALREIASVQASSDFFVEALVIARDMESVSKSE